MRMCCIAPLIAASLYFAHLGALPQEGPGRPARAQSPLVTIHADGNLFQFRASSATVAEVLREADISLGKLDRTSPAPGTPITDGMTVRVTRVSKRQVVEEAIVPSKTVLLATLDRPAGFSKVLEYGTDGVVRRLLRVWEKDGQVTQQSVVREQVVVPVRDTVVLRGARGLASRGGDWRRPLRMQATAYDPGPRSCGRHANGYTAIGVKATKGIVAVDDRVIPMGTRLYIPGYGFAVAADRGRAIKGRRIDLCFDTYAEAVRWGRRRVDVYMLD